MGLAVASTAGSVGSEFTCLGDLGGVTVTCWRGKLLGNSDGDAGVKLSRVWQPTALMIPRLIIKMRRIITIIGDNQTSLTGIGNEGVNQPTRGKIVWYISSVIFL
jgi:hypothetical protein